MSNLENFLKKQESILSIIDFDNTILNLKPDYFESKTQTYFEDSLFDNGTLVIKEIIFKTNSDYFIYLLKNEHDDNYQIKILFEQIKKQEVMFLIRSLNKKTK